MRRRRLRHSIRPAQQEPDSRRARTAGRRITCSSCCIAATRARSTRRKATRAKRSAPTSATVNGSVTRKPHRRGWKRSRGRWSARRSVRSKVSRIRTINSVRLRRETCAERGHARKRRDFYCGTFCVTTCFDSTGLRVLAGSRGCRPARASRHASPAFLSRYASFDRVIPKTRAAFERLPLALATAVRINAVSMSSRVGSSSSPEL